MNYIDAAGAALALIAACFWFASAGKVPGMVAYWDATPPNDPFFQSINRAARMNRWAALFSGLAAVCPAVHVVAQVWLRQ